jgi:uncharacterized protein
MMRLIVRLLTATSKVLCITALCFGLATIARAAEPAKVLMVTQSKGFVHGSVNRGQNDLAVCEIAMTQLGKETGLFDVTCTQNVEADFTKENLQKYSVVMFYTTGSLPIAEADREYFFNTWLKTKGHAFIGFHSATDTYHDDERYWDMIGGTFNGHPWNSGDTVTLTVHDTAHPAMKPLGPELVIKDEIYQYKNWQPKKVHVLMSIDMSKTAIKKPYLVPVSWVNTYGDGKVFVTNLGHNEGTWANELFLAHVTGGIKWVLNQEPGDATPNPDLSAKLEDKAKQDAGDAK